MCSAVQKLPEPCPLGFYGDFILQCLKPGPCRNVTGKCELMPTNRGAPLRPAQSSRPLSAGLPLTGVQQDPVSMGA
jgi:hypothetical protein